MFSSFSLRQWLTLPYIALVLVVAVVIGALSYRTGSDAVDTLSNNLLLETVHRIEQTIDRHLMGSAAVLESAFPAGMPTPDRVEEGLDALRARMWAATSLHRDPNNYIYYGNAAGQTLGVFRHDAQHAEMRFRNGPLAPGMVYPLDAIDQPLPEPVSRFKPMDPRQRPWYQAALTAKTAVWTSVYIDYNTLDLVVTRAKRVTDNQGRLQGVVGTDVALHALNDFVRTLQVSPNGMAFVMEPDGKLIASSRTANVRTLPDGTKVRVHAADAGDELQALAYASVLGTVKDGADLKLAVSKRIAGPDGSVVQLAFSRMRDDSGLDWLAVVAVPRSDFMQGINGNVMRTIAIGVLAALTAMGFGLVILNWLSADLRKLTEAARRVGEEGEMDDVVSVYGHGGITTLAHAFSEMQVRLRTDALTGLNNRDMVVRSINDRIQRARRNNDQRPFALLFIDLNKFKRINDTLGHDAGDKVLIETGRRLLTATRTGDTVARYAGDEFVVLLDNVADAQVAEKLREQVEKTLREPLTTVDLSALKGVFLGGAVGVACYPGPAENAEDLVRLADEDMYRRKTGNSQI